MLTIFTVPKAFKGHIDIIQRNAIKSWSLFQPECEVILVGDDEGTAEAATDLRVKHIPQVERNEFGTPLLNSAFSLAQGAAMHPLMCHINADIILMNDFLEAVQRVKKSSKRFLMTAQRWELDIKNHLDFDLGWEDQLRQDIVKNGKLSHFSGIDFWVYSTGLVDDMPPFAVGRIATESWLLYKTRMVNADLIDSTQALVSIHQNHDYAHHPDGLVGIGTGIEAQRNRELAGGKSYFFCIRDRTHVLTPKELRRTRDGWWMWRTFRTSLVLQRSMPVTLKLVSRVLNGVIDIIRDFLGKVRHLKYSRPTR